MDAVEEIKSRLDIVDVVQEYLPLKPAGTGSFKANCPFHQEKTPSFYVNRPRQGWHCFGCDQGGDLISFVMRMEGMEFREVLELLATKTGVVLPVFDAHKQTEKKRLYDINDMAARWFRQMLLTSPAAEQARGYVQKRHIDELTGDVWRIGYAPSEWSGLTATLLSKGVTEIELLVVGLASRREKGNGVYDRFRDRVMFPICDVHGNIVGFTGRTLSDDKKEAKYVNTPETAIYKKSNVLYGLHFAKGDMKRQDLAVLVEGNMDVVSSHRVGVTNVVAASGTALTIEHLRLLKRFTKHIAIAFDQDRAGMAATIRGLDLARREDFSIRVISLPDQAKDPDELIVKNPDLWKEAIRNAVHIIDWLYRKAFSEWDSSRPEGKKMIAHALMREFAAIPDPIERDGWVVKLAADLDVSEQSVRELLQKALEDKKPLVFSVTSSKALPSATTATLSRQDVLQRRMWAMLELAPTLRPLAAELMIGYPLSLEPPQDLLQYLAIIADREFEDQSVEGLQKELRMTIKLLREEHVLRQRHALEQDMRAAERAGDTARIQELLAEFNNLHSF